ncbi:MULTISPECIES: glutamine synthetase family protein [Oceanospirillaceae]|jgi:glutamine synthetase|uniref:Glutamine synthetase family protein n=1 Tax=Oceanobacter antarcticus TaxID=3133425 RepID=A0ABW8NMF0_9GAMM|tara:strand:- start:81 stop:1406 length:1326 start_codon:yes stop_codon:yes gene_type:complete
MQNDFDLFIVDLNGNLRGKRLLGSSLDKVYEEGVKLPRSVIGVDFWGGDVPDNGLVFETGDNDGICIPVQDKPTLVPWAGEERHQLQAMMMNPDGSPFNVDPRQVLKNIVDRFHERGWYPVMATELEFYLMDGDSEEVQRPRPPVLDRGHGRRLNTTDAYSIEDVDGLESFFAEVRAACDVQGVLADTIISELGPGQFEINLKHVSDPLNAGDQSIWFKRLVKGIARKHGYTSTFMAKPYAEHSGNGFHVHFSLVDKDGNNLFDNGGEEGTEMLTQAIAGLLELMPSSMLLFAPHLNSYRRFQDGSHAPVFACWGYENRTTAVRVPEGDPEARRLEHRVSGADANPYLVLAAVLAGSLYGLNNKLVPPEPMEGDAYADSHESTRLPYRWDDAIKALDKSAVLREYLGDEFVDVFCAIKRQEITELNSRISDIEYESYLGLL